MRVVFDDGTVLDEDYLLAVAANGLCYGGFHPAPLAKIDDGIIDFCGFTRVSRFFISRLVGQYKAGKHLEHPALKAHVNYKRCTSFTVESDVPFTICMDGEISSGYRLDVRILPRALQILLPASCVPQGKTAAHQVKGPAAAYI